MQNQANSIGYNFHSIGYNALIRAVSPISAPLHLCVRLLVIAALTYPAIAPCQDGPKDFAIARPGKVYAFPAGHGSHPDYKIEWWYLTGHLFSETQRRFGFEATFFRLAQRPEPTEPEGAFGDSQIYMAHMAITDVQQQAFYHEERFNREGWNAYARVGDLDVRNGNWSLVRNAGDGTLQLEGSIQSKGGFSLNLNPAKEHVIFGENGVSKKGRAESAASHYITWTRLLAQGTLQLGGETFQVKGTTWMDHEISSSQLDEDQTGWDWVSIQFEDGRELMAYMLRLRQGGYSPYSKLVWIEKDGTLTHLTPDQFSWHPGGDWTSPDTGATYPISPHFTAHDPLTGQDRTIHIHPLMPEQEMTGKLAGVPYWEGACDVVEKGKTIGRAYLELAGYVDGLTDQLK